MALYPELLAFYSVDDLLSVVCDGVEDAVCVNDTFTGTTLQGQMYTTSKCKVNPYVKCLNLFLVL